MPFARPTLPKDAAAEAEVSRQRGALVFRSAGYFLRIGARCLRRPTWLTPGLIEVVHREERAGCIVEQLAFFPNEMPA